MDPAGTAWPPPRQAWGTVAVLLVAYIFSFMDRQILSLLVGPIKADLHLSDTEFSLLSGFAFALFYTVLGIPFGRLADRMPRRRLIAVGALVWSAMTVACGFARSFGGLFAARVGVGVGEATLSPAAFSMMSDLFPRQQLGRAFSVYSLGIYIGTGIAFGFGGLVVGYVTRTPTVALPLVGPIASWHASFLAIGLPGLLLPLLLLLLPEPRRRRETSADRVVPLREAAAWAWARRRLFAPFFVGFAMLATSGFGILAWAPTMFARVYHVPAGQAGFAIGLVMAAAGSIGVLAGGMLTDRWTAAGRAGAVPRVGIVAAVGGLVPGILFPLMPGENASLAMLAIVFFFGAFASGSAPSALGIIVPNELRGQVSALYLLVLNVIAIALGPTLPAVLTDFVFHNEARIGWSLSVVAAITAPAAIILLAVAQRRLARPLMP